MQLAQKWLAMREEEIEENPEILLGRSDVTNITLANAIEKYLDEVGNEYGRTKTYLSSPNSEISNSAAYYHKNKTSRYFRSCCFA